MVCLGNICRSPMAEGIMRQLADKHGLNWTIDSAGTGGWHTGQTPDSRAIHVAFAHHINISNLRARQFSKADFDRFDKIYVMDRENYNDVMRMTKSEKDREKVELLLNELYPGQSRPVPDPWYDDNLFEPVFQLIYKACEKIMEKRKAKSFQ